MGSGEGGFHGGWYRAIARHYDGIARADWDDNVRAFLDRLFRRHDVRDVLDIACGTFRIDLDLLRMGYDVVGRDLSSDMIAVARESARREGVACDVAVGDMRTLRLGRTFDAVLCLGTAFNYLTRMADVRRTLRAFRRHLRPGGILVLDLANFASFIDDPTNARAEVDHTARDGTRVAVFAFNEQNAAKTIHTARFLTVIQKRRQIDISFDEAPLRVWRRDGIRSALEGTGFRAIEWHGDLAVDAPYRARTSPRLVVVARPRQRSLRTSRSRDA